MTNPACPDKATLELLLRGKLGQAESESLGDHLRQCEACANTAETIPASDGLSASSGQNATTEMRARGSQEGVSDQLLAASQPLDYDIDFLAPAEQPDELGRLGGYRILEVLGVGGMGLVFRAEDPKLERLVALKVMKPTIAASKSAKDRFLREAKATAALEHHNIVQIYQVGEDRGVPFIAMQYLRGESLQKRLSREKKLGQREVLRIGREVADGLEVAHERGLIHRDIKPDNIWLDQKTGGAKILDFGLARATAEDTGLTQTGAVLGTPRYMAPEQAQGQPIDYRCDLFSLGNVLYHLAAGQPAFDGSNLTATLIAVAQANPRPIATLAPALHPDFARLIMRLLSKERDQRPQSAAEVSRAIAQIEKQLDSATTEPTGQHVVIAPTIQISKPPKVDRSLRDRNVSSHGVTRLLSRSPVFLRGAVALAAIAAFIVCGVIIIKITNKDGTVTEIKVPEGTKIEIESRMDNPVRPTTPPRTTTNNGDPTNMPDRIVRPTTETPTPSTPATDPDRAAAEWVLSRRAYSPPRVTIRTASGNKNLGPNDLLPPERFDVLEIQLIGSDEIDDETFGRFIAPLKNLKFLWLEGCPRISDQSVSKLELLTKLDFLEISGTEITPDKTIELISALPITQLGLDTNQFSTEVADKISLTPRLTIVAVRKMDESQFRLLLRVPHLKTFNCNSANSIKTSSWARLPEALPNLVSVYAGESNIDDPGLLAISRLDRLQVLGVDGCRMVTDKGLALLTACRDLIQLSVTRTAVTPLGLADFLESHPACQVDWDGADHRAVAEWVWSVGGKVQVAGRGAEWLSANVAVTAPRDEPKVAIIAPRDEPRGTTSRTGATSPTSPDADQPAPNVSRAAEPSATTNVDPQGSSRGAMTATLSGPVLLTGVDHSGLATLQDADLARLADCTTLRDLQLHNSSLTGAALPQLTKLKRLAALSLATLPIQDDDLAVLAEFPHLANLQLHQTPVTDAGLTHLVKCSELYLLVLNQTQVTNEGVKRLTTLPKLAALGLSGCEVDDAVADVLLEFPALIAVFLENTPITDHTLQRLGQRQSPWGRLYLSGTKTTDAGLAHLRDQTNLFTLGCIDTSVTSPAFAEFVRQHPVLGMTLPTEDSAAPDLRVARRVLAAGGTIALVTSKPLDAQPLMAVIDFQNRTVTRIEDLPNEPFRITYINLSFPGVKATPETFAEIGGLDFLGHFSTAHVATTDTVVAAIANAPKLIEWHLADSPLPKEMIRRIVPKTNLTALSLHNTGLDGPTAASLAALTKLKILSVGSNPLSDDDITFVEKLTELETLNIGFTQIVNHGWASIIKLPKLKQLYAYNMPVTDEALRHAGQIESLELLHVGGTVSEVGDAGLQHLRSLRHLRELQINHCHRLTDGGLEALAELPALETLHLNATPITDAGLQHLAKIKTLKFLDLTECQLSDSAIDDLQDALPWCRIQHSTAPQ